MKSQLWITGPELGQTATVVGRVRLNSNMSSIVFDQARAAFDALAERADQPTELWNTAQRQEWLELVETLGRILPALQHEHINHLAESSAPEDLGGRLAHVLADRLRI